MSKASRRILQGVREVAAFSRGEHVPGLIVHTPKTCPNCGASFMCNALSGDPCWCMDLPELETIEPALDCLCPACLRLAIAGQHQS